MLRHRSSVKHVVLRGQENLERIIEEKPILVLSLFSGARRGRDHVEVACSRRYMYSVLSVPKGSSRTLMVRLPSVISMRGITCRLTLELVETLERRRALGLRSKTALYTAVIAGRGLTLSLAVNGKLKRTLISRATLPTLLKMWFAVAKDPPG